MTTTRPYSRWSYASVKVLADFLDAQLATYASALCASILPCKLALGWDTVNEDCISVECDSHSSTNDESLTQARTLSMQVIVRTLKETSFETHDKYCACILDLLTSDTETLSQAINAHSYNGFAVYQISQFPSVINDFDDYIRKTTISFQLKAIIQ